MLGFAFVGWLLMLLVSIIRAHDRLTALSMTFLAAAGLLATPRLLGNALVCRVDEAWAEWWTNRTPEARQRVLERLDTVIESAVDRTLLVLSAGALLTLVALGLHLTIPDSLRITLFAALAACTVLLALTALAVIWMLGSVRVLFGNLSPTAPRTAITPRAFVEAVDLGSPLLWTVAGLCFLFGTAFGFAAAL